MPRRRQKWSIGDVFLVENADHLWTVGQVVGQEAHVLNCVSCAFYDVRVQDAQERASLEASSLGSPFAVLFVTRDLLDTGIWPVVAHRPVEIQDSQRPYEHLRDGAFVGAKVVGAGIARQFLDAFYGLAPWDDWKDPKYLDGLLISPDRKPRDLVFKKDRG